MLLFKWTNQIAQKEVGKSYWHENQGGWWPPQLKTQGCSDTPPPQVKVLHPVLRMYPEDIVY